MILYSSLSNNALKTPNANLLEFLFSFYYFFFILICITKLFKYNKEDTVRYKLPVWRHLTDRSSRSDTLPHSCWGMDTDPKRGHRSCTSLVQCSGHRGRTHRCTDSYLSGRTAQTGSSPGYRDLLTEMTSQIKHIKKPLYIWQK